jgi:hypothetical protein
LLTPQGRWRIKGFRRNEFDNIVDGQIIVSGIGLVYDIEFDTFDQLFSKIGKNNEETVDDKDEQPSATEDSKKGNE